MSQLTPMMQHYIETKNGYKDCILFYRLGDFYEMFFEDAVLASKELEIALTGKSCGQEERAPMCGIPFHAAEQYINKLIKKGYKVAICEQVEDPKQAKGIVKREVVRIVTPGTNFNMQLLDEEKNQYIMCLVYLDEIYGIAIADITTGDFFITEVDSSRKLLDEIQKFMPREIICNESFYMSGINIDHIKEVFGISIYSMESWYFDDDLCKRCLHKHFQVGDTKSIGISDFACGTISAGALLQYLYETQKTSLTHLTKLTPYTNGKFMVLDSFTRRNLELTETLREKQKRGSLLWVLDRTKTAMGARMLRTYLEQPLIDKDEIEKRLDAISDLNGDIITRDEIREYLNSIYDLERILGKISYQSANPRDLIAFKTSLSMLPHIKNLLGEYNSVLLSEIGGEMDGLEDIHALIDCAINEDPPISVKDGGIIKNGYHDTITELRKAKTEGK